MMGVFLGACWATGQQVFWCCRAGLWFVRFDRLYFGNVFFRAEHRPKHPSTLSSSHFPSTTWYTTYVLAESSMAEALSPYRQASC
jgi:hypothetical protein